MNTRSHRRSPPLIALIFVISVATCAFWVLNGAANAGDRYSKTTVVPGNVFSIMSSDIEQILIPLFLPFFFAVGFLEKLLVPDTARGLNCFPIDSSAFPFTCTESQPGVPMGDALGRLPLVLGIGPAKTASTTLFDALNRHPGVLLGNASLQGHKCCGSELYYFSRHFNHFNPTAGLSEFFNPIADEGNKKPKPSWLAEKTPEYSDHLLVPHRVKATLSTPDWLALAFSIREPIDAHVSLYFHRMELDGLPTSIEGFIQWSQNLLDKHRNYILCVERILLSLNQDPSMAWQGNLVLDTMVHFGCRAMHYHPADDMEGIGSLMYSQTMPRWRQVLGNKTPIICVFHSTFLRQPQGEARRVAKFLGLDPELLPPPPPDDIDVASLLKKTSEQRVLATAKGMEKATEAMALREHLEKLKQVFAGETEFAAQFCDEYASS